MKKLIVFLLFAFVPMIAVGLYLHYSGNNAIDAGDNRMAMLVQIVFSAGAMLIPLLAVVFTQLIFKEPLFKGLGISFRFNRWWWIGWLLMPVLAIAIMGVTLLMPGAEWVPNGEAVQAASANMPAGLGVWGILGITIVSGMVAGATINTVFAFGEEIAWRGFLMKQFKGRKFLTVALIIGIIWGFWHAPLILNGHNYPQHPVAGVFLMVLMCLLLTPILMYFRQKSGSVLVAAIMHGTLNAVVGISAIAISPANDLLYGGPGLAGMIVLLATNIILFIIDRYILKDNIFASAI